MKSLQKQSYGATIFAVIPTASYHPSVCYMTLWHHKHSNGYQCDTSHLYTSMSAIQCPCFSFCSWPEQHFFFIQSANNSPVGAVLASSWFIFVPYNILIVYCKAKYLTVKIDFLYLLNTKIKVVTYHFFIQRQTKQGQPKSTK